MLFTRPLAFKLLAPTVLVSLALVGACISGAFSLRRLHLKSSEDLSENVHSTQAAIGLENTAVKLIKLFRGEGEGQANPVEQVLRHNTRLVEHLRDADKMANHDTERDLVAEIDQGVQKYLDRWRQRDSLPRTEQPKEDRKLADLLEQLVLPPCDKLHRFNSEQIESSNDENQAIVNRLNWGLIAVGLGAPVRPE